MKTLLFAVVALFAISMLAPGPVTAEPTHFNEIGLYTTPDGYGETGIDGIGIPLMVYLVLTKPALQWCSKCRHQGIRLPAEFQPRRNYVHAERRLFEPCSEYRRRR